MMENRVAYSFVEVLSAVEAPVSGAENDNELRQEKYRGKG
jgi:hypothetical protein